MVVGRSKRRKPAEERVDVLAIAQSHLVEAQARMALALEDMRESQAQMKRDMAKIMELYQTLVEMIDRLPGRIGFGRPPAT